MSSSPGSNAISVPDQCVGMVILDDEDSPFYLEILLDTIESLCLKSQKYLSYLGWSILVVEGFLVLESDGDRISTNGDLDNGWIYYYIMDYSCTLSNKEFFQAVDLEVIKMRTNVSSETMQSHNEFCNNCWNMMVFVCGQELPQRLELVYISFPLSGVLRHLTISLWLFQWFQLIIGNISDQFQ
ncbi:hypothetical protein BU17DRAFT_70560 [Hysterangium stoloniferum]|nr:hypothetical protein BU17DRAFT_70560 [Hysterangium stoloniferum]